MIEERVNVTMERLERQGKARQWDVLSYSIHLQYREQQTTSNHSNTQQTMIQLFKFVVGVCCFQKSVMVHMPTLVGNKRYSITTSL